MATISLPKSTTFLANFCKGVKNCNFYSEIIFGQLLWTIGNFLLVTLAVSDAQNVLKMSKCNFPTRKGNFEGGFCHFKAPVFLLLLCLTYSVDIYFYLKKDLF